MKVIKSHIPIVNTPTHIDVPVGQLENTMARESKICLKYGIPIGINNKIPRKKKH